MISSNIPKLSVQERIDAAREEAKFLVQEIDRTRASTQDAQLIEISSNVPTLNRVTYLKPYQSLRGHGNKISSVRWSNDSRQILSASQDGFMIIWDATTAMKVNAIPLSSPWVLACAYSPNGRMVASGGLDNACTLYRISHESIDHSRTGESGYGMVGGLTQNIVSVFKGHTAYISGCEFLSENFTLTSSGDMTCALWDVSRGSRVREFMDHLGDVLCLAVPQSQHGSQSFVSGASDGYIRLWDIRQRAPAQSHFVAHSDINCMKFFPDANSLATGSDDGSIRLFDFRADCQLASYTLPRTLRNSSYGKANFPMATPQPQYAQCWQGSYVSDIESLASETDTQSVSSLDFSASGRMLYGCIGDYGCVIFDTLRTDAVGKLEGHSNRVNMVSCSPDGMAVCTASWDSTIKIWSI
ncbi:hypothetical protein BABINDRAFT_172716 [Babjeviella inositovora NRRL Y-12698]|uniref:Uncharacterized protein n=1 Tax=Babjeviella inositovora NRRL Y-12698 TaxID=984486 RepID=A0A1E3QJ50_9ASCO|nr:uncharacterized protein BABINDRAFT_172716 [Babjeviella inositovora NRRL Y-12698]ODQ77638.1 hypothetical protein BABINDRAFT_172716 [Babjeviella inositovora NRRL Y-12698]